MAQAASASCLAFSITLCSIVGLALAGKETCEVGLALAGKESCEASLTTSGNSVLQAQRTEPLTSTVVQESFTKADVLRSATGAQDRDPDPETGIWDSKDLEKRPDFWGINECMADELLRIVTERGYKSVLDLGAGTGAYSMYLKWTKRLGGTTTHCCDGNKAIIETSGGLCSTCDLTESQLALEPADLVFSFEVAEHIPKEKEAEFLSNVQSKSSNLLLLSWAIPGQHGDGHVNCQTNDYVVKKMSESDFMLCDKETQKIRDSLDSSECIGKVNSPNFVKTLMVFSKDGSHC